MVKVKESLLIPSVLYATPMDLIIISFKLIGQAINRKYKAPDNVNGDVKVSQYPSISQLFAIRTSQFLEQ